MFIVLTLWDEPSQIHKHIFNSVMDFQTKIIKKSQGRRQLKQKKDLLNGWIYGRLYVDKT